MRLIMIFILSVTAAPLAIAGPQSIIYYGDEQGIAGQNNTGHTTMQPSSSNQGYSQQPNSVEQKYTGEVPLNWEFFGAWPKVKASTNTQIRQEQLNNKYPG